MAAIILPHRRRAPSGHLELNWNHPLAPVCRIACAQQGTRLVNLVAGINSPSVAQPNTGGSGPWYSWTTTAGPGLRWDGTGETTYVEVPHDESLQSGSGAIFMYGARHTEGAASFRDDTTTYGSMSYESAGSVVARWCGYTFSTQHAQRPTGVATGTLIAGSDASGKALFCYDRQVTIETPSYVNSIVESPIRLGINKTYGTGCDRTYHVFLAFNTFVGLDEYYSLLDDPWQLFQPLRRRIYIPSAAAGGTTIDATRVDVQLTTIAASINETVAATRADLQLDPRAFSVNQSVVSARVDVQLDLRAPLINESVVAGRSDIELQTIAFTIEEGGAPTTIDATRVDVQLSPYAPSIHESVIAGRADLQLQTIEASVNEGNVVAATRADVQLVTLAASLNESISASRTDIQLDTRSAAINEQVAATRVDVQLQTIAFTVGTIVTANRADIELGGYSPAAFINEAIAANRCDIELQGLAFEITEAGIRGHTPGYPKRRRGRLRQPDWSGWEEERRRLAHEAGKKRAPRRWGELETVEARVAMARQMLAGQAATMVELDEAGIPVRMGLADARRSLELSRAEIERLLADEQDALAVILIAASV